MSYPQELSHTDEIHKHVMEARKIVIPYTTPRTRFNQHMRRAEELYEDLLIVSKDVGRLADMMMYEPPETRHESILWAVRLADSIGWLVDAWNDPVPNDNPEAVEDRLRYSAAMRQAQAASKQLGQYLVQIYSGAYDSSSRGT